MLSQQYISALFLFVMVIILSFMSYYFFGLQGVLMLLGSFFLGVFLLTHSIVNKEAGNFREAHRYQLIGEVKAIQVTDYYQWVTMTDVSYGENNAWYPLKSKIEVRMPLDEIVTENDGLRLEAIYLATSRQMNPSDFDTPLYLKGQGICATFKCENVEKLIVKDTVIEYLREEISERITHLYQEENQGIMRACILGEDEDIFAEVKDVYNESGIGHVLAISGYHVSVLISVLCFLLSWLPIGYIGRQMILVITIWSYAFLTGDSVSTLRAVIMGTLLMTGRCLWQEDDHYTSLALAAAILLIRQPYQLFQVSFQLSFIAVFCILLCIEEMEKKERFGDWKYPKWQKSLLMWLLIQMGTWPILAYHFYEIPFWISLINLLIIPLYGVVIIGGWLSIIFYPIGCIALLMARGIELILGGIVIVTADLLKWPFATLCIGRENGIAYCLYGGIVWLILSKIFSWSVPKGCQKLLCLVSCCYGLFCYLLPGNLKITGLYVGQGDSIVIETPNKEMLVIDGGNVGKGETVEQYVKYCGKREIKAMFLSHSDADHICGLMELIASNLSIGHLFISESDHSELLDQLMGLCEERQIPVTPMKAGDVITIASVKLTCVSTGDKLSESTNDHSMVQLLSYGQFRAVFTGDISKNIESSLYSDIGPVTFLKVSHHGSRTGTDEAILLKLCPSYAMISCGIHNLYGHPHQEVVAMLDEIGSAVRRTDIEGAICLETNGTYLIEKTIRKEVSSCP